MAEADIIRKVAAEHGLSMLSEPIADTAEPYSYFIYVAVTNDQQGRQLPGHKALANARQLLLSSGIKAKYILVDPDVDQLESSLRASLISSYPNLIRNVFLSSQDAKITAWLDTKNEPSAEELESVERHVVKCCSRLNARATSVLLISNEPVPTNAELLIFIRKNGPLSCEELRNHMEDKGFSIPSLDWINRKFDALRKSGLVVRIADRTYSVTLEGLQRLGTAKGRHSPDVTRLLALARSGR